MAKADILELIIGFFHAYRPERDNILQQNLTKTLNNLAARNMLASSVTGNQIARLYADELVTRADIAWNSIKDLFERRKVVLSVDDADKIREEIKKLINSERDSLSNNLQPKLNNMRLNHFKKEIDQSLGTARSQIISKVSAELNLFLSSDNKSSQGVKKFRTQPYVDAQRMDELKSITSPKFDLSRLIRLCEEINISHQNECHMSIAMAVRAIIDHVPPIFGFAKFSQVESSYSGAKSFKESMTNLENSLRKIADAHLHVRIRKREMLPTFSQVNFSADLDVLLSEIIRILK